MINFPFSFAPDHLEVLMPSNFWMMINNEENFRITQNRGFTLLGLKAQHRRKVQRITEGDRVLLYIRSEEQRLNSSHW